MDLQRQLVAVADGPFLELTLMGIIISAILYGVVLVLFIACLRLVQAVQVYSKKMRWFMMIYIVIMFGLDTLAFMQQTFQIIELIFRPTQYEENFNLVLANSIVSRVVLFAILGADYLMIWRCIILYQTASRGLRIFTFTLLGFVALASGIGILLYLILFPGWPLTGILLDAFLVLSLINNALLSVLITSRILYHQRRMRRLLGISEKQSPYTRVIAICVESCVLMIFIHGIYIALSLEQANGSQIPFAMLPHLCVLSAYLLIYQVARGRSMTPSQPNETRSGEENPTYEHRNGRLTALRFDPGPMTDHFDIYSSHESDCRERIPSPDSEGRMRAGTKGLEDMSIGTKL